VTQGEALPLKSRTADRLDLVMDDRAQDRGSATLSAILHFQLFLEMAITGFMIRLETEALTSGDLAFRTALRA
jgi:hypothetical protein